MGVLTLYKGVELNNKYNDVFNSSSLLESYLSGKEAATITDNFYFKTEGELKLSLANFTDVPNYMKFADEHGTRYFFIQSYEYYNNTVQLRYMTDVWHTYRDIFDVKGGHRTLTNAAAAYKEYVTAPVYGTSVPAVTSYGTKYTVISVGYGYTGTLPTSGIPSAAQPSIFLWSNDDSLDSQKLYVFDHYIEALRVAANTDRVCSNLSWKNSTTGNTMYAYTISTYIIPVDLNDYYSSDANDATWITMPDERDATKDRITRYLKVYGEATILDGKQKTESSQATPNSCPLIEKTFSIPVKYDGSDISVGTLAHMLQIPQGELNNLASDTLTVKLSIYINYAGLTIYMSCLGQTVDVTADFEYSALYNSDSLLAATQRKQLAIQQVTNSVTGAFSGLTNSAMSLASGSMGGVTQLVNTVGSIANTVTSLSTPQSGVTPSCSYNDIGLTQCNICKLSADVLNAKEMANNAVLLGYKCDYSENAITMASGSFTVVEYDQLSVIGEMPENYKNAIETIFNKGVRIWTDASSFLQFNFS